MGIGKWLKNLFELAKKDKSAATAIEDKDLGMGRQKRRHTEHEARRAGKGEAYTKPHDWKAKKRQKRQMAKASRRANR